MRGIEIWGRGDWERGCEECEEEWEELHLEVQEP
jgi:hypothetical protein